MKYINQDSLDVLYSRLKKKLHSGLNKEIGSIPIATFQKVKYKDLTIIAYSSFEKSINNDTLCNFPFISLYLEI